MRKRHARTMAFGVVMALSLVACGAGDQDSEDTSQDGAEEGGGTVDAGAGTAAPTNTTGETLVIATPAVQSTLDPEFYEGTPISIENNVNFSGRLFRYEIDKNDADSLPTIDQLRGDLVDTWEESDDGQSYTMTLRDVKSPFGNSVSAEDVRWSIQRHIESDGVPIPRIILTGAGWSLEDTIEVIDDTTFRLNIDTLTAISLSVNTLFSFAIFDSTEAKKHATSDDPWAYEWLNTNYASYGPYMVTDFEPSRRMTLKYNPGYYRDAPAFEEVVVTAVPDASTRVQLVLSGDATVATQVPFDQAANLEADDSVSVLQALNPSIEQLAVNMNVEPFTNQRVRQALAYAVDREAILSTAYKGYGVVSDDFFHKSFGVAGANEPLEYDLERAKSLLADEGLADGFDMTLTYNKSVVGPWVEDVALELKNQLDAVNVNVQLEEIASAADFDAAKREEGGLQAWIETSLPLVPDPAYYLGLFYVSDGPVNQRGYASDDLDSLQQSISTVPPGDERDSLIMQANSTLLQDMPAIPIIDADRLFVVDSAVSGFRTYPDGQLHWFDLTL